MTRWPTIFDHVAGTCLILLLVVTVLPISLCLALIEKPGKAGAPWLKSRTRISR